MTDRREILDTAASLIGGERQQDYGSAADNFARIGNLWAEVLGVPVSAVQVALCMGLVKVARLINSPDHLDSWVDGAGYLALGGEIATREDELLGTPRQWDSLADVPKDVDVVSAGGATWRWYRSEEPLGAPDGDWLYSKPDHIKFDYHLMRKSPFTEVIE